MAAAWDVDKVLASPSTVDGFFDFLRAEGEVDIRPSRRIPHAMVLQRNGQKIVMDHAYAEPELSPEFKVTACQHLHLIAG